MRDTAGALKVAAQGIGITAWAAVTVYMGINFVLLGIWHLQYAMLALRGDDAGSTDRAANERP